MSDIYSSIDNLKCCGNCDFYDLDNYCSERDKETASFQHCRKWKFDTCESDYREIDNE
jgi:hypothetical protein